MDQNFFSTYSDEDTETIKYTDFDFENVDDLYQRNFGTIVFLVPNQLHFGCNLIDILRWKLLYAPFEGIYWK